MKAEKKKVAPTKVQKSSNGFTHVKSISKAYRDKAQSMHDDLMAQMFPKNRETKKHTVRKATKGSVIQYLTKQKSHATVMCSAENGAKFNKWADTALASMNDAGEKAQHAELLKKAIAGDNESKALLAESVKLTTSMLLMASSNWLQWYRVEELQDDGVAYIQNNVQQEMRVSVVGEDGMPRSVMAEQDMNHFRVTMFFLTSDIFEYKLVDLYKGHDVADAALKSVDIARDIASKIDAILQSYIMVGVTQSVIKPSFQLTGALTERNYVAHSRVDTSNFPTGNLITLNDNTATSGPRLSLLKAVITYCTQWGSGAFEDGDLRPAAIHFPSLVAARLIDDIKANSTSNTYVDQVFEDAFVVVIAGFKFLIIPDNTLSDADKHCYVRMNKPVGVLYLKPSLDKEVKDESFEAELENVGRVAMRKALGVAFPVTYCVNALAIRYRT